LSLVLITAILLILVQYSIVISKQTERIKELTQELGLLAEKLARLQERLEKLEKLDKLDKLEKPDTHSK
jgi:predicted nuclease with TOPRIM domain